MHKFNSSQTIGEIVAIIPEADKLFMEYEIDSYIYEYITLGDVIEQKKLDKCEVLEKLNNIYNKDSKKCDAFKFMEMSPCQIADNIINNHNNSICCKLHEVCNLLSHALETSGPEPNNLMSINDKIIKLQNALQQAMEKEQKLIGTNINNYDCMPCFEHSCMSELLNEIEIENNVVDYTLKDIKEISRNCRIPKSEFASYWQIVKILEELKDSMVKKSNNMSDLFI